MPQDDTTEPLRDLEAADLTDKELLDLMRDDESPVGRAWRVFRTARARLDLVEARSGIIELRRQELHEVLRMLRIAGVRIRITPKAGADHE